MTTLVVTDHAKLGRTLWGRLCPNVESCEQVDERGSDTTANIGAERIFPWLVPTRTSNPKAGGRPTTPADVHPLQIHWGMPRRIRLRFEEAKERRCGLTAADDSIVVASYRARNYGTNYSEGFLHPLSPYYRKKAKDVVKLPFHPKPGGVSYRLWPGVVVSSGDGLREPATVIRHWLNERDPKAAGSRFAAFGYDMDNMKARAWMEGEMPLLCFDDTTRACLEEFIRRATAGADTAARLVIGAVKSALYDRPKDAAGGYDFIAERFFRDTEDAFHTALRELVPSINADPDTDRSVVEALQRWVSIMAKAASQLFDEYAPSDGLEDRNMHRHVKARFQLMIALNGRGKVGKALFERDLGIPSPETTRSRNRELKAA